MIATGTDVKPIEVLIFMRDVRSEIYFEQMKGRGVRSIRTDDLVQVTPDAKGGKERFVVIDAVGVTETAKSTMRPLERQRTSRSRSCSITSPPATGGTRRLPRSRPASLGSRQDRRRRSAKIVELAGGGIFMRSPRSWRRPIPTASKQRHNRSPRAPARPRSSGEKSSSGSRTRRPGRSTIRRSANC